MKTMYIDPGLCGTGWAVFRNGVFDTHGVEHHLQRQNTTEACAHITKNMASIWGACREIVIEHPELWTGDATSYAAAKSGNLFKLCRLIGALETRALPRKVRFIFPREWKGQLTKAAVIQRLEKRLGFSPPNHAADAIGMGISEKEGWTKH